MSDFQGTFQYVMNPKIVFETEPETPEESAIKQIQRLLWPRGE